MPWDSSNRHDRLPPNWPTLREAAIQACGRQCEWIVKHPNGNYRCPDEATEVDHKIAGDNHSPSNLRGLCSFHHAIKSSAEGHAAKRKKLQEVRSRFRRPADRHPADKH